MKTQTTHTATPWKVGEEYEILGPNEKVVATAYHNRPEVEANAAFIVRAVNSHEELLQSLKDVLSCYKRVWTDAGKDQNGSLYIGIAEKAIAKAEGK